MSDQESDGVSAGSAGSAGSTGSTGSADSAAQPRKKARSSGAGGKKPSYTVGQKVVVSDIDIIPRNGVIEAVDGDGYTVYIEDYERVAVDEGKLSPWEELSSGTLLKKKRKIGDGSFGEVGVYRVVRPSTNSIEEYQCQTKLSSS